MITGKDLSLKDWILAHPAALGDAVLTRFSTDLPFLFKVRYLCLHLSIPRLTFQVDSWAWQSYAGTVCANSTINTVSP